MAAPTSTAELLSLIGRSGLVDEKTLQPYLQNKVALAADTKKIAATLVQRGVLTAFQARCVLSGKHRGLLLGSYKILDQIGQGGMGTVYLAEHLSLRRKAAIKVLAAGQA